MIALLDVDPPRAHEQARPVIKVGDAWRPYDVVREFASEDEARAYAAAHGITDVDLGAED
jgi:hypothetical protein